ncbi:hypothetical protein VAWG004_22060 [Aeromonas veronii]|nr:hypothetical protein VAWG004_22060 [Aeromonas veronii]
MSGDWAASGTTNSTQKSPRQGTSPSLQWRGLTVLEHRYLIYCDYFNEPNGKDETV